MSDNTSFRERQARMLRIIALVNQVRVEMDGDENILSTVIDNHNPSHVQVYFNGGGISAFTDAPATIETSTNEQGRLRIEHAAVVEGVRVIDCHTEPAPEAEGQGA